jgi:hypothetical protein
MEKDVKIPYFGTKVHENGARSLKIKRFLIISNQQYRVHELCEADGVERLISRHCL